MPRGGRGAAGRAAAAVADREGLEQVRLSVEALERLADPSEVAVEVDVAFHRGVAALTGNEYLTRLLEPIWETMNAGPDRHPAAPQLVGGRHPPHRRRAPGGLRGAARRRRRAGGVRDGAAPAGPYRGALRGRGLRRPAPTLLRLMFTATDGLLMPTTVTGLVAAAGLVHGQPRGSPAVRGAARRRLPRAAHRRRRGGRQRPGARRPRHPHQRRLPPGRRPRRPVLDALPGRADARHRGADRAGERPPGAAAGDAARARSWRLAAAGGRRPASRPAAARVRQAVADRPVAHRPAGEVRHGLDPVRGEHARAAHGRYAAEQARPDVGHGDAR